jgi:agmatine deiminase
MVANKVEIAPSFRDPSDEVLVADIFQKLYPDRKVVSMDITEMLKVVETVHCFTQ